MKIYERWLQALLSSAPRSRVLARLASLAQIGELARRLEWGKNSKPKKIQPRPQGFSLKKWKNPLGFKQNSKNFLDQKLTTKKYHDEFPNLQNSQRAVEDITHNKKRQPRYAGTTTIPRILRLFWISKQTSTKSSHPKKYLPSFPTQNKILESKISNLSPKSFDHPRHFNSGVSPPTPIGGWTNPVQSKFYLERLTSQTTTGKWILKMFYSPFRSFEQLLTSIGVPRSLPLFKFQKC